MTRKPTRANLLYVIEEAQRLFGQISGAASDRNKNRAADLERIATSGLSLCITARECDEPDAGRKWP